MNWKIDFEKEKKKLLLAADSISSDNLGYVEKYSFNKLCILTKQFVLSTKAAWADSSGDNPAPYDSFICFKNVDFPIRKIGG